MASRNATTIAGQLAAANMIIENTLAKPAILDRVTLRGYSARELAEGQQLYRTAVEAVDAQAAAAGAALLATDQAQAADKQAREAYQRLAQTARALFPLHSSQRKTLEVVGPMPHDTATFIAVATTLFNNALKVTEINIALAKYGYDTKTLQDERDTLITFQQAVQAQAGAQSASKQATRAQSEALDALQRWIAQYVKIAKIALKTQPELLKALGITTPSGRASSPQNDKSGSGPQTPQT
jgi:hypothetical protein